MTENVNKCSDWSKTFFPLAGASNVIKHIHLTNDSKPCGLVWVQFYYDDVGTVAKPARHLVMQMQFFCVYRPYKEPISKEMNNDNNLNLHLHDQMSGWLRYCVGKKTRQENRNLYQTDGIPNSWTPIKPVTTQFAVGKTKSVQVVRK